MSVKKRAAPDKRSESVTPGYMALWMQGGEICAPGYTRLID